MFSLEIQSVPVAEFPAAAGKALFSMFAELSTERSAEALAQAKGAVEAAIALVKGGHAGSENVYAVIGGRAYPGHAVSVGVYSRPSPGGVA